MDAGRAAGCPTVLVEEPASAHRRGGGRADHRAPNVLEAARIVAAAVPLRHPARGGRLMDPATLNTKIYADGADLDGLLALAAQPHIKGFTTNPTLMRKAGITDYATFAKQVLEHITDRPISFEVFSDDVDGMRVRRSEIACWGPNVYVKIPVTNTRREPMTELVRELSDVGRPGQRHGVDDPAPGHRDHRRARRAAPRATSRCSPAGSPTPAATRCRSCATPSP